MPLPCIREGGDWLTWGVTPGEPVRLSPAVLESFARRISLKWPLWVVPARAAIFLKAKVAALLVFLAGVHLSDLGGFTPDRHEPTEPRAANHRGGNP